MEIAYLTNAEPDSGVGYYSFSLAAALKQSHFGLVPIHLTGQDLFVRGQKVRHLTPWPGLLGSKSLGWLRLRRSVLRAIKNESPELVHATNQSLSFIQPRRLPRIVTVHDIIEMVDPQDSKAYFLNRFLYAGIESATHLIAVSEYTKKSLIDFYGLPESKITVIPNGVSPHFHYMENFRETISSHAIRQWLKLSGDEPIVLYVGSEHPRKNFKTVLLSFANVLQQHPNAILLKVGQAGLRSGRRASLNLIDKLGIRDNVRFVGPVSYDQLNELYNLAHVLIFPSRFEGFGLPVIQAMAAGLPVVTSNTSSLPEVAGNAAIVLDPDNVDGFSQSLLHVLSDKTFAQSLREKGLAHAKHYSWEQVAEKTSMVYRLVLAQ